MVDYIYTHNPGISEPMSNYLLKILDACQLPLLGSHLNISDPRIIYAKGIHVGILRERPSMGSVIFLSRTHTQKSLEGMLGKLVISVKIPPDPSDQLYHQLQSLFGSGTCQINLK